MLHVSVCGFFNLQSGLSPLILYMFIDISLTSRYNGKHLADLVAEKFYLTTCRGVWWKIQNRMMFWVS